MLLYTMEMRMSTAKIQVAQGRLILSYNLVGAKRAVQAI